MTKNWSIDSWRGLPIKHQPVYKDNQKLEDVEKRLKSLPPLVFAGEARTLKEKIVRGM